MEDKAKIELREVKREAQEMYGKFINNQDALEKETQKVENIRRDYDKFDS